MMLRWLPPVLWIAVILGLSSIPGLGSSRPLFPGVDKLVHMGEYSVLGFLVARALWLRGGPTWKVVVTAAIVGAVMGFVDETYQASVPGRNSDPLDGVADFVGATIGGVFWLRWIRRSTTPVQRSP